MYSSEANKIEVKVGQNFVANKTFSRKEINGCKNVSEVKKIYRQPIIQI